MTPAEQAVIDAALACHALKEESSWEEVDAADIGIEEACDALVAERKASEQPRTRRTVHTPEQAVPMHTYVPNTASSTGQIHTSDCPGCEAAKEEQG